MTNICHNVCLFKYIFHHHSQNLCKKTNNLPFAELLERWTDDAPALHHTVSAHPDISQIAPDDAVIHDNSLRNPERNIC